MCRVLNFIFKSVFFSYQTNEEKMEQFIFLNYLYTFNNYTIYLWARKKMKIVQSKLLFLDLFLNFSSYDIRTIKYFVGKMIKGKSAISSFIKSNSCWGKLELIAIMFCVRNSTTKVFTKTWGNGNDLFYCCFGYSSIRMTWQVILNNKKHYRRFLDGQTSITFNSKLSLLLNL